MEECLKLTVEESIIILGLLPQETNYRLWKDIFKFEKDIKFTEDETRQFDIDAKQVGEQMNVTFNKEVTEGYFREVKIPMLVRAAITAELEKRSQENKLTRHYVTLYEKFCVGGVSKSDSDQVFIGHVGKEREEKSREFLKMIKEADAVPGKIIPCDKDGNPKDSKYGKVSPPFDQFLTGEKEKAAVKKVKKVRVEDQCQTPKK